MIKYVLQLAMLLKKKLRNLIISKNVYNDKLDDLANKYDNRAIKAKGRDVKSSTYIDSEKGVDNKDPKFKIGDIIRISKYKSIFAKGYFPNWPEEVFVIKKVKNTAPWAYVISDFKGEEIAGIFNKTEL